MHSFIKKIKAPKWSKKRENFEHKINENLATISANNFSLMLLL